VHRGADGVAGGWPAIPPAAVSWLTPELDSLADEITGAIVREVPEYARPDDDSYARTVRQAAWDAVHGFVIRIASPATPGDTTARDAAEKMFRDIGRVEAARGHSLDALHAALRVGARVTWQRLRDATERGSADIEVPAQLGEAIFRHLDDLAAASAAGHAQARAELAGEAQRLRQRLLDMLVSAPPAPPRAVASLAAEAGWRLPRRVSAVAVAALAGPARAAASPPPAISTALPPDVLVDLARRDPCLLIPDPDGPGRRQQLEAQLRSWLAPGPARPPGSAEPSATHGGAGGLAAIGPAVPLERASDSLRWARQAIDLAGRGIGGIIADADGPGVVIHCDDHLATLVLLADTELAALLSRQALAPLRQLRPDAASRLAATLLAWLESADNAETAARRLHVHPQTVRYRLRQVTELFGDALAEPEARFRLQLALRARSLAAPRAARP
jgi:PucR C-terminal helix-turn-helix domain